MTNSTTDPYGDDLFSEPDGDDDTLASLGPLRPLAGSWEGSKGVDVHPVDAGRERSVFLEHYDLAPIDSQTNGPQLFYGLRYHTNILEVGKPAMFHDQVGYWLWEPTANAVTFTLAIPRGQVLLAIGSVKPDATTFEVRAEAGTEMNGIGSNPFLLRAFRTVSFRMTVTVHDVDSWSYEQETVLEIPGRSEPFLHTDANTLHRVGDAVANPLARHLRPSSHDHPDA